MGQDIGETQFISELSNNVTKMFVVDLEEFWDVKCPLKSSIVSFFYGKLHNHRGVVGALQCQKIDRFHQFPPPIGSSYGIVL